MEDNTELKDKDSGELGSVCLRDGVSGFPGRSKSQIVRVIALMAKIVFAANVRGPLKCFSRSDALIFQTMLVTLAVQVAIRVIVAIVMTCKLDVTRSHQLQEEHNECSHQSDCFRP